MTCGGVLVVTAARFLTLACFVATGHLIVIGFADVARISDGGATFRGQVLGQAPPAAVQTVGARPATGAEICTS